MTLGILAIEITEIPYILILTIDLIVIREHL